MRKSVIYISHFINKRSVYLALLAYFLGVELIFQKQIHVLILLVVFLLCIMLLVKLYVSTYKKRLFKILIIVFLFFVLGVLRYQIDKSLFFLGIEKNYSKIVEEEVCVDFIKSYKLEKVEYIATSRNFGRVIFSIPISEEYFEEGERLLLKGELSEPFESADFSYKNYLKIYKVNYVLRNTEVVERYGFVCRSEFVKYYISKLKSLSCQNLDLVFPEPASSLIKGLSIGLNISSFPKFQKDLQISGLGHITAVSGYNMTLVLTIVGSMNLFFNKRKFILIISVVLLFYGFLVGFSNYAAMRALIMSFFALFASFSGRKSSVIDNLVYSAFVLGFFNPLVYKSIGFVFSSVATLGLCTTTRIFENWFFKFFKNRLSELSANLAASVWIYPLSLYNFHTLSLHSFILNLVLSPIISVATLISFGLFLLSIISLRMLRLMWFLVIPFELLVWVIQLGGRFKFLFMEKVETKFIFIFTFYFLVFLKVTQWYFNYKFLSYTHKLTK